MTFSWMRCNHTDGMPRGDFNIYFANSRGGYVRAEEYVYLFFLHWNQGSPLHESIVYSYVVAKTIKYMMI